MTGLSGLSGLGGVEPSSGVGGGSPSGSFSSRLSAAAGRVDEVAAPIIGIAGGGARFHVGLSGGGARAGAEAEVEITAAPLLPCIDEAVANIAMGSGSRRGTKSSFGAPEQKQALNFVLRAALTRKGINPDFLKSFNLIPETQELTLVIQRPQADGSIRKETILVDLYAMRSEALRDLSDLGPPSGLAGGAGIVDLHSFDKNLRTLLSIKFDEVEGATTDFRSGQRAALSTSSSLHTPHLDIITGLKLGNLYEPGNLTVSQKLQARLGGAAAPAPGPTLEFFQNEAKTKRVAITKCLNDQIAAKARRLETEPDIDATTSLNIRKDITSCQKLLAYFDFSERPKEGEIADFKVATALYAKQLTGGRLTEVQKKTIADELKLLFTCEKVHQGWLRRPVAWWNSLWTGNPTGISKYQTSFEEMNTKIEKSAGQLAFETVSLLYHEDSNEPSASAAESDRTVGTNYNQLAKACEASVTRLDFSDVLYQLVDTNRARAYKEALMDRVFANLDVSGSFTDADTTRPPGLAGVPPPKGYQTLSALKTVCSA
jgi:hypothetical protein